MAMTLDQDALRTLIDHAEGRVQHAGHDSRDDACPVCRALQALQRPCGPAGVAATV